MEAASAAPRKVPKNAQKKGKRLPRRAQDLSKEELLLTLQKKRECNAKALKIVEGMLEPNVQEGWFLDMLQHINQSHYQDIIEERAITNLCGYPLCTNELKNIPSQQYRISTKLNKVYDIKDRKNFCSNKCFWASNFIKDQMHTSPLWLRDIETKLKIVLMPSTGNSGGAGDEVPVQVERVTREEVKRLSREEKSTFMNSNQFQTTPSSEQALADALNNLHLVASLRENSPPILSERIKDTRAIKTEKESEENANACYQTEVLCGEEISSNEGNVITLYTPKDNHADSGISSVLTVADDAFRCNKEKPDLGSNNMHVSCFNDHTTDDCVEETKPLDFSACQSKIKSDREIAEVSYLPTKFSEQKEAQAVHGVLHEKSAEFSTETLKENSRKLPRSMYSLSVIQPPNSFKEGVHTNKVKQNEKFSVGLLEFTNQTEKISSSDGCIVENVSTSCLNSALAPKIIPEESLNLLSCDVELTKKIAPKRYEKAQFVLNKTTSTNTMEKNCSKKSHVRKQSKSLSHKPISAVALVEKCVEEWFTMETMCFLFGESALKDMLEQKGESIQEHYKALRSLTWDQEKHERFLAICKRLSLLEMEDSNFDSQMTKSEAEQRRKPLPDYGALKKEAESMELKIRAFYQGKIEIDEKKVSFADDVKTESREDQNDEHQIPLVHLHSQRALRKKIVLHGLNRVLPDFLRTFGVRPSEVTGSIHGLISTFAFSPSNITFKPPEWSLLGLIVIKLLALREPELKICLQQEQSKTYMTLMLMSYKQEPEYLDRLLSWLTDIDKLLAKSQSSDLT